MPETQVDDREQQRLAELEELKRPRISEEQRTHLGREVAERIAAGVPSASVRLADVASLLDEIDRLERRWQRMATGGPLGALRRQNANLSERVTLLGLQIRQQGQVIEHLKAKNRQLAARADADEGLVARMEMRAGLDARVAESALRQARAMGVELEEEQTNHALTRERLADARREDGHAGRD